MKKLLLFFIMYLTIISCVTNNNKIISKDRTIDQFPLDLNLEELNIVNDLLEVELESERYKTYKNYEIMLIEEMGDQLESLLTYEFAYKDFHSNGMVGTKEDNQRLGWILDKIQIKEKKETLIKHEKVTWNVVDIKKYKVNLIKYKFMLENINSGKFLQQPEKLLLHITRPLLLDKNNAFVSFRISSSHFGKSITKATVLMTKKNNKWTFITSYDDGMFE